MDARCTWLRHAGRWQPSIGIDSRKHVMIKVRILRDSDEMEWLRLRQALWPDHAVPDLKREMTTIRTSLIIVVWQ